MPMAHIVRNIGIAMQKGAFIGGNGLTQEDINTYGEILKGIPVSYTHLVGRASRRDCIFSRVWHTATFVITGTPLPARATCSDS